MGLHRTSAFLKLMSIFEIKQAPGGVQRPNGKQKAKKLQK